MKISKVILGILILAGSQIAALASPFTITCQTYEYTTGQGTSVFSPGDKVVLVLTPTFNNAAAYKQPVTVTLSAKATVSGVSIPYTISNAGTIPNTNPSAFRSPALLPNTQQVRMFNIPRMLPPSTLTVSALVTITGVGSATCSSKLTVR
jgi:hypothetical protein